MFQFTHPGKGATGRYEPPSRLSWVSIHAPWEGCDAARRSSASSRTSFNSRTLGRVRPYTLDSNGTEENVSIHAPWEGCDEISLELGKEDESFNSRTLGRVRPFIEVVPNSPTMFQFTHPGKGAT